MAWFALSYVLDYFLISVILMVAYKKVGGQRLSVNRKIGKLLLSRSKYYIIPSLMVIIFQHTDQIMIKLMIGETATGLYTAAISCIAITAFVFDAITDSSRPVILEEKQRNHPEPVWFRGKFLSVFHIAGGPLAHFPH